MPNTAAIITITLPKLVLGDMSPYPTVVIVIIVKYKDANYGFVVNVFVSTRNVSSSKSRSHHQITKTNPAEVSKIVYIGSFTFLTLSKNQSDGKKLFSLQIIFEYGSRYML